jgi:hypothetical protein
MMLEKTAKGTLIATSDNIIKVRKLKFSVCGKEEGGADEE